MTGSVLKDYIAFSKDGEWGKGTCFDNSVEVAVIRGTDFEDVQNGILNNLPIRYIPKRIFERKKLQANDVIIETAGGSKDRPTGRVVFLKEETVRRSKLPLICASFSRFIRVQPDSVVPEYLYWYLHYMYKAGISFKYHTQHTGVARFQWTVFSENEQLYLQESQEEQIRIAKVLSAYNDLIENNNRRIAILEEMAQSLYREWFVKFRFPGHEKAKVIDSPLGKIPDGWEVVTLNEFCSKVIDGTHDSPKPADDGFYLVTGRHIKNGFIDFANAYLITEEEHKRVMARSKPEKGDVIFSNIGTLGNATIVDQDFEYSIKNVALFKPKHAERTYFFYLWLTGKATLDAMLLQASGTSQKFLSLKYLRGFKMVAPANELLLEFNRKVQALFELRALLANKIRTLKEQRDLILPKLISGKIDLNGND